MDGQAPPPDTRTSADRDQRHGFAYGIAAYTLWGVLPIYFKLLHVIAPVTLVAHRVCWSLALLFVLLTATRGWPAIRAVLADLRTTAMLATSALLIGGNWLVYVYAVNNGHILASSLGYYLNPIANVLLGRLLLKERLSRLQWAAVAIAGGGIAVLGAGLIAQLWISLLLCLTFAFYGLVRKLVAADALTGLGIETGLLFPLALTWLLWTHQPGAPLLAPSAGFSVLIILLGLVSTAPLLLFTAAARRLPLSTLGMLQFLAPTLQFLIAVLVYGEPFTAIHAIAFTAIWAAIGLYLLALAANARRARVQVEASGVLVAE